MVPSVRPGTAPSAEDRWSPLGQSAGPLPPEPAVTAARHAPLYGAWPRPAPPPAPPRARRSRPAPTGRPAQRISWNSCPVVGTSPSPLGP